MNDNIQQGRTHFISIQNHSFLRFSSVVHTTYYTTTWSKTTTALLLLKRFFFSFRYIFVSAFVTTQTCDGWNAIEKRINFQHKYEISFFAPFNGRDRSNNKTKCQIKWSDQIVLAYGELCYLKAPNRLKTNSSERNFICKSIHVPWAVGAVAGRRYGISHCIVSLLLLNSHLRLISQRQHIEVRINLHIFVDRVCRKRRTTNQMQTEIEKQRTKYNWKRRTHNSAQRMKWTQQCIDDDDDVRWAVKLIN